MQVIIGKEVIVILRAYYLILQFLFDILVRIVESSLVLPQLSIVILVVEVFGAEVGALSGWIPELL